MLPGFSLPTGIPKNLPYPFIGTDRDISALTHPNFPHRL